MIGVYKITSPTGRIYIGQSINIEKRRRMYVNNHCKKQQKLYASLVKYGFENHTFEVIEECDESLLNEREEYWIEYYNTFNSDKGMNLSSGGLNKRVSEETKRKISNSKKGIKRPDVSLRQLGKPIFMTPETREKIRLLAIGRKHKPDTIEKMRQSALNRPKRSDATRKKMSESAKKKIITEDHKRKLLENRLKSDNVGKKVINNETGEIHRNLVSLCRDKNMNYGTMKARLRGALKNNTVYQYL